MPLLPALNLLLPVGTVLAERLLYLPSVGVCMLAAPPLAVALLPPTGEAARAWPVRRAAAAAVPAGLLLVGGARCLARGPEWEDDVVLFEAAATTAAGARSAKVHLTLGALAARAGDGAAAAAAFRQALAIHPGYEDALYSLGRLTMEAGDSAALTTAEPLLAEAVRRQPLHGLWPTRSLPT